MSSGYDFYKERKSGMGRDCRAEAIYWVHFLLWEAGSWWIRGLVQSEGDEWRRWSWVKSATEMILHMDPESLNKYISLDKALALPFP